MVEAVVARPWSSSHSELRGSDPRSPCCEWMHLIVCFSGFSLNLFLLGRRYALVRLLLFAAKVTFFSVLGEVSPLELTTQPVKLSRHCRRNASQPPFTATTTEMGHLLTFFARWIICELIATHFVILARCCDELS